MTPPEQPGARSGTSAPAPPVPGLRERKKQATRAGLEQAALRLVVRVGVQNVTIDQIADDAGVSQRTFFNYFATKEEALVAATAAGADDIIDAYRARPASESVLEAMSGAVFSVVEKLAASPAYVDALQLVRTAPSLVPYQLASAARHEAGLALAIAERIGPTHDPDDAYPVLCAVASLAALRVALDRWLARRPRSGAVDLDSFRAEVDRALRRLAAGLDHPGHG